MADVQNLLGKIQAHCNKNRIRITEFFNDFDKLRSGLVSREQFKRCIAMLGMVNIMNDYDFDMIFRNYSSIKEPSKINYYAFCDAVDAVFTFKNMEKNPMLSTTKLVQHSIKRPSTPNLTPDQWDQFERLMKFFVDETTSRGLILKEFFRDFDFHSCGRVTASQFQRCFPFRIDTPSIDILVQRYKDESGDVNYLAWVYDVEDIIASRNSQATTPKQARRMEPRYGNACFPAYPPIYLPCTLR
eukprot:NODE_1695_length_872_cov_48.782503_g1333_i0.p1 GENE.NODE_1695_length_872_cov_48.782503_g1333_i0~~NODE_1695_length_872_cov_48.782503_g1333_i0.p1  ORF type:complete len:243 (+),score=67.08 NODE_1695_length_872_cov_48.782503_g1333_i0:135-863(+)